MSCMCCDWFFADPELESPSPECISLVPKERSLYMSWDLSIYRLQLPSLHLSNLCERTLHMAGAIFQAALLSGEQTACWACCIRPWGTHRCQGQSGDALGEGPQLHSADVVS